MSEFKNILDSLIKAGTIVDVQPETPKGRPLPAYSGIVEDVRLNIKGLGSVEYLVNNRWVIAQYVKTRDLK